jgi:lysozyme
MDGPTYTKANEGCKLVAYQDTLGVWTIGYGCTGPDIVAGLAWTIDQAEEAFERRYSLAVEHVAGLWTNFAIDNQRTAVLVDMAYQLGGAGLREFHSMLAAVRDSDWQGAHDACLDSLYARQTPLRAARNANALLTGELS